jgi:hypothetical protein
MERPDAFKSIYLGLLVGLLGLKYLIVVFTLLFERIPAIEPDSISEIRVLVPMAALLLGAYSVRRHGCLRPRRGGARVAAVLALFGLGYALASPDGVGLPVLMLPALAALSSVGTMLLSSALWTLWIVAVWLFGGRIVGVLFWRRLGMDDIDATRRQGRPPDGNNPLR